MKSDYLSSLIAAIECGSIAEAARQQGITAAALSQRIQVLERELNAPLLNRIGHSARPTDAALAILPRARRIVREVEMLSGDIHANALSGTLKIGAISTALTGLLPSALVTLHRDAPNIMPQIVPGTSSMLYASLEREEIDVAIIVQPPFDIPKRYRWQALHSEELTLIANTSFAGSVKDILTSQPYISYDPNSWGGRLAHQYLNDNNLTPRQLIELDGLEAISLLVKEGMGVSLVPRWPGLSAISSELVQTPLGAGYDRIIIMLTRPASGNDRLVSLLTKALTAPSTPG